MDKIKQSKIVLKYSKYGLIQGSIFLFPAFPIFTLLPLIGLAKILGDHFSDCETGYKIAHLCALVLAIVIDVIYLVYTVAKKNIYKGNPFTNALLLNSSLYLLVNSFVFISFIGTNSACHGDGQTILYCIYSGPIASLFIFVNGIVIDLVLYFSGLKR